MSRDLPGECSALCVLHTLPIEALRLPMWLRGMVLVKRMVGRVVAAVKGDISAQHNLMAAHKRRCCTWQILIFPEETAHFTNAHVGDNTRRQGRLQQIP